MKKSRIPETKEKQAEKSARISKQQRKDPPKRMRKMDSPTPEVDESEEMTVEEKKELQELQDLTENLQQPLNPNDRFYCTNANLLKEMYKWRNSSTNGIPVMKLLKNGKMVPTEINENTDQKHEPFQKNTTYVIKYEKTNKRFQDWQEKLAKIKKREEKGIVKKSKKENPFERPNFISVGRKYVVEDVTNLVEYNGWTFDIDDPLDPQTGRVMSENFGRMIMMIAQKISNHSYFRNYSLELKQDCQSYSYEKIIKGLFNYSFRFTNAFAYLTQACFNSFKSILAKHYKQINIKRDMTKKSMVELDVNIPGSSMRKSLNNQFEGNDFDSFQEF